MILKTKITELIELLETKEKASIDELSQKLEWDKNRLELTAKVLEKTGLINVVYPANVLSKPFIKLEKKIRLKQEEQEKGEKIKEYSLTADNSTAKTTIIQQKETKRPFYFIDFDKSDNATNQFIEQI